MPKKKTEDYTFPMESCGTCKWLKIPDDQAEMMTREHVGICYYNPPMVMFDGEDISPARPVLEWNEPACAKFSPRNHA